MGEVYIYCESCVEISDDNHLIHCRARRAMYQTVVHADGYRTVRVMNERSLHDDLVVLLTANAPSSHRGLDVLKELFPILAKLFRRIC